MLALTSPYLWYLARATGIMSLLLLTAVTALGIMTATRIGGRAVPRFAVAEVHRRIALMTMIFLAIHIAATVLDTYVHIGVLAAIIPFTSSYKTLWVALGSVAFDLLLAVTISSLIRQRLSHAAWRTIHWLSYLAWPIALVHVVFIGTDVRFGWMDLVVLGCIAVVGASIGWRLWAHPRPDGALTAVPKRTAPKANSPLLTRSPTVSVPRDSSPRRAPDRSGAAQGQRPRPIASSAEQPITSKSTKRPR